ncbi:MAG: 3'-5' exonuclease [Thermodesulfovibrionales bacterium]
MGFITDCVSAVSTFMGQEKNGLGTNSWSDRISLDSKIRDCPFVSFDMEMSGLNHKKDFIVSIGAIKMKGGRIHAGDVFYRLVKPEGELQPGNVVIHGITPDDLTSGEDINKVLSDFMEFISDSVLVGHFVHFDLRFINAALKKHYQSKLKNPAIDTHDLHLWLHQNSSEFKRYYRGGSTKKDLFTIAERYGISVDVSHDALNDAFIAAQLFQRFIHFLEVSGIVVLRDLIDIGRA